MLSILSPNNIHPNHNDAYLPIQNNCSEPETTYKIILNDNELKEPTNNSMNFVDGSVQKLNFVNKMRTFQIVTLFALIASAVAFAPPSVQLARPAFKTAISMSEAPLEEANVDFNSNQAAIAAIATALAPLAANAADIDEGTVIGYGAGLVACVVSLAVGFSIGYGTLVR